MPTQSTASNQRPDLEARRIVGISDAKSSAQASSYRAASLVIGCWWLFLIALVLLTGTLVQEKFTQDTFVYLNGAWKVHCGLRPHTDFYTSIGPFSFILPALAMPITGISAYSITIGKLLLALLLTVVFWFVLKPRLSPFNLCICLIYASLQFLRYNLPSGHYYPASYASFYNHMCSGILILLTPSLFLRRYSDTDAGILIDSIVVGAAGTLLLFFKFTFPADLVPLVGISFLFQRSPGRRIIGMIVGCCLFLCCMAIYMRFDFSGMVRDIQMMLKVRGGEVSFSSIFIEHIFRIQSLDCSYCSCC